MNQDELLINMARYIHAIYDIDVGTDDPKLNVKLKKYVEKIGPTDKTLQSYWDAYIAALTGKTVIQSGPASIQTTQTNPLTQPTQQQAEEKAPKKEIIYRGRKI